MYLKSQHINVKISIVMNAPRRTPIENADMVTGLLVEAITSGDLEFGQPFQETWLADRAGISKGPIQRGLGVLTCVDAVEIKPSGGVSVLPTTKREIAELLEFAKIGEEGAVAGLINGGFNQDTAVLNSVLVRVLGTAYRAMSNGSNVDSFIQDESRLHQRLCLSGGQSMSAVNMQVWEIKRRLARAKNLYSPTSQIGEIADADNNLVTTLSQTKKIGVGKAAVADYFDTLSKIELP